MKLRDILVGAGTLSAVTLTTPAIAGPTGTNRLDENCIATAQLRALTNEPPNTPIRWFDLNGPGAANNKGTLLTNSNGVDTAIVQDGPVTAAVADSTGGGEPVVVTFGSNKPISDEPVVEKATNLFARYKSEKNLLGGCTLN